MHTLAVLPRLLTRFAYILDHYGHAQSRRRPSARRGKASLYYVFSQIQIDTWGFFFIRSAGTHAEPLYFEACRALVPRRILIMANVGCAAHEASPYETHNLNSNFP